MAIIEWRDDRFLLGVPEMDDTHIEFVDLTNRIMQAPNDEFAQLYDRLIEHTHEHFEYEDRLMVQTKFPATAEHRDEHQRVLGELALFNKRVRSGLVAFGRNYIRGRMAEWFMLHAATMDSALAAHIKARQAAPPSRAPNPGQLT
jgi:hemerythrin